MDEFIKQYKSLNTSEFLKILEEPNDYKPSAVEAAKSEIENRKLSEDEIIKAKENLKTQRLIREKQIKKNKELEYKFKELVKGIFGKINPFKEGLVSAEIVIRLITIILSGILIYKLYKEFRSLIFILSDLNANWDLSLTEYFFPFIVIPMALILFWKRKRNGWILLSIFLTYSTISTIGSFILSLGVEPTGNSALDSLFPTVSPTTYLLIVGFYGGTLWEICQEEFRKLYRIEKKVMKQSILLTTFIYLVLIF